jgi:cohesin loading factor subunit SCC2
LLEDKKTDASLKNQALDWMSRICCQISNRCTDRDAEFIGGVDLLMESQKSIVAWIEERGKSEDGNRLQYARLYHLITWAQVASQEIDADVEEDEEEKEARKGKLEVIRGLIKEYAGMILSSEKTGTATEMAQGRGVWIDRSRIQLIVETLASKSQLYMSFDLFFGNIISCLESEPATLRSKALKCLQDVILVDGSCLERESVQRLMADRLLDPSTNVRDSAIDLLGKIIGGAGVMERSVLRMYYPMLSRRVLDVGVNVRKRIIRVLRDIYASGVIYLQVKEKISPEELAVEHGLLVDIVVKLVGRVKDEEETVRVCGFLFMDRILR